MNIKFGNLDDIITPAHTKVVIGNTTTSVIAANESRNYLLLINDSDEKIYIKLGAAAVSGEGIAIAVAGTYEISPAKGNLYKGAINGICASGSKNLLVTEG